MKSLSIKQWKSLASESPNKWEQLLRSNISACISKTDTAVISSDLSQNSTPLNGVLGGVPYCLKDLFDYAGIPTHSSSKLPFLTSKEAQEDCELVGFLKKLGASCAAKTQMNEFAYGLSGENPHYGNCPHPTKVDSLSGGSSSGSAFMVAAGYLPLGFGTDTGVSIRLPASWCGVYGIRWVPQYFMEGGFPLAPSFDSAGWFTKTAEDMEIMLNAWFSNKEIEQKNQRRGKVFLPEKLLEPATRKAIASAVYAWGLPADNDLADLESMLPSCRKAFNVLQSREAFAIHKKWLSKFGSLYDPMVRQRIERAQSWTNEEVATAEQTMKEIESWFSSYFLEYDFLAMPVCPGPSIPLRQASPELRENTLQLTSPASLGQRPALTIPIWLDEISSVGVQFIFNDTSPEVPLDLLKQCGNS